MSQPEAQPVMKIVGFDKDGWRIDTIGRRHPSTPNLVRLARAVPGLLAQFKREVPAEFVSEDEEGGTPVTRIACPCGETPAAPVGRMAECACERFYLNTGSSVRVANSPAPSDA